GSTVTTVTGNVYVGYQSGMLENGSNKFHFANSPNYDLFGGDALNQIFNFSCLTIGGFLSFSATTVGGNMPAATYFYKLTGINKNGESHAGSQTSGIVTSGTTSSINLTWNAIDGADSYRVYRGTSTNGQNVYYTVTGTSFVDTYSLTTISGIPPSFNTAFNVKSAPNSVSISTDLYAGGNVGIGTMI